MRTAALILPLALLACSGKSKSSDDSAPTTGNPTGTTSAGPTTGVPTGTTVTSAAPPVANTDSILVDEGAGRTVDPIANDTSEVGLSPLSVTLRSYPQHGTLTIAAAGIGYTHDGSESFTDSFTYTVDDILGQTSNEGQIAVTITPVNDPPDAVDDVGSVDEGGSTVINVVTNDIDVDDTIDLGTLVIVGLPQAGTATANLDGTVEYVQDGSDLAQDGFTYQINDMAGATSNTGAVIITINDINDPPIAVDDTLEVAPNGVATVRVVANDIDPDDGIDPASIVIVTQPTVGTLVIDAVNGAVEYTHTGPTDVLPTTDSFTYTVADFTGVVTNVATVDITIDVLPVLVGSFQVSSGPVWNTNPAVLTCKEACATVFGGVDTDYQCSTTNATVDHLAKAATWGYGGCQTVAEDFKADQGTGYDCGFPGCSTSAYVQENCFGSGTNYCWQ